MPSPVCRQCGATFDPAANPDGACTYHPGDYHEGSGVENYESDWWDCEEPCKRTGRHVARGERVPGCPSADLTWNGATVTLQQPSIRIGCGDRCDLTVSEYNEYTYYRLWWQGRELWAEGCGSMHWYRRNGEHLPPRTPVRLVSGDRLSVETRPPILIDVRF